MSQKIDGVEVSAVEDVVIIGSGPAGHTAGIYAARAELKPLMFEGNNAGGVAPGGQLTTTTYVENFPGFVKPPMGWDLMYAMRTQSESYGTRIVTRTVGSCDLSKTPFEITLEEGGEVVKAKTIIIATGATARRMHIPGEEKLWMNGISACAVCDGALPCFRNKDLYVVGGGDSAVEEAVHLTKFASSVTMLVRRDELRASKIMRARAEKNEKLTIKYNTSVVSAIGDEFLTGLTLKSNKDGTTEDVQTAGLFYAIGHVPNSKFLDGAVETDEVGYINTAPDSTATTIPGVFAAGDISDRKYRQAITAAGSGCMAALEVEHFLADQE